MTDHSDLVERLELLGDALDFDDVDLASAVLLEVRARRSRVRTRRWLAAAGVLLVVGAVASYPDSRQAVARWFGFDSLSVEIDPELSAPAAEGPFDAPGPGERLVVASTSHGDDASTWTWAMTRWVTFGLAAVLATVAAWDVIRTRRKLPATQP